MRVTRLFDRNWILDYGVHIIYIPKMTGSILDTQHSLYNLQQAINYAHLPKYQLTIIANGLDDKKALSLEHLLSSMNGDKTLGNFYYQKYSRICSYMEIANKLLYKTQEYMHWLFLFDDLNRDMPTFINGIIGGYLIMNKEHNTSTEVILTTYHGFNIWYGHMLNLDRLATHTLVDRHPIISLELRQDAVVEQPSITKPVELKKLKALIYSKGKPPETVFPCDYVTELPDTIPEEYSYIVGYMTDTKIEIAPYDLITVLINCLQACEGKLINGNPVDMVAISKEAPIEVYNLVADSGNVYQLGVTPIQKSQVEVIAYVNKEMSNLPMMVSLLNFNGVPVKLLSPKKKQTKLKGKK